MASPAHGFYCFEALDASFERRSPPKLERVLELYDHYIQAAGPLAGDDGDDGDDGGDEEVRGRSEDNGDDDGDVSTATVAAAGAATSTPSGALSLGLGPQNPSISRLQKSSASSASSRSSSASSPSTATSMTSLSTAASSTVARTAIFTAADSFPLFVTWKTVSSSGHQSLRGCIGTFEALPLEQGLQTYATTAAFDDTRFSPIPASLVPSLSCSLTLLADFEPCADALDWVLGTHGIRISFTWRNRRYGATYLPDVAVEQEWTKEETLESLMKKAGWDSSHDGGMARRLLRGAAPRDPSGLRPWEGVGDFRVIRYTGLKASASYAEWQAWRAWVQTHGGFKPRK